MSVSRMLSICLVIVCMLIVLLLAYKTIGRNSLAFFGTAPSPSGHKMSEIKGEPDSIVLKIRQNLQRKEFEALNLQLDSYQRGSESDVSTEEQLLTAYKAFDIMDINYEPLFNAWVDSAPGSYQPYLARANYYYQLGWASRGTKWASETKKGQFDEMNGYFGKAVKDLETVLSINKQAMVAYNLLIGIANAQGKDDESQAIAKSALAIKPASYTIRAHYLTTLTPRWGGSVTLMEAFIEKSMRFLPQNPRLKLLQGLLYADAADMQALSGKYSVAEKLYEKALTFGENHIIFNKRGENSCRQEKYQEALNDLNRAIGLYPEDSDYYYWRSKAYSKLEDFDNAATDILRATDLDPYDKHSQELRKYLVSQLIYNGYESEKNGQSKAAIERYDTALRLDSANGDIYYRRSRTLINLNQFDSALSDLKTAIELDPDNFDYYHLLDWVLTKHKDWDRIIIYWNQYIEHRPDNSRAYVERGGAHYHKGDLKSAVKDAKIAADMGNPEGREAYEKFRHRVE